MAEKITVKEAIRHILDFGDLCDDGPRDEGWRSERMYSACELLEAVHDGRLTDEQREWRKEFCELSERLGKAILAIDGPYSAMTAALDAHRDLYNFAIDDEDCGPCVMCGEPIWILAEDEYVANDDGDIFCISCVDRPAPGAAS